MSAGRVAGLAALGLVVYAATLLLAAPAERVLAWVDPPGVTVHGAGGRAWAGHARRVEIAGAPLPLTDVSWDIAGWRLVTGELGADIEAGMAGLETSGYVARTGERTARIAGMTLRGGIADLLDALPYPVAASGSVLVRIEEGRVADGIPRGFRGRAVWSEARLQAPIAVALGEVVATFAPEGDAQGVDVRARGGAVDIDGRIDLQSDGRYQVELALKPTDRAGSRIRDTLTLVARPDEQGRYVVRQRGRLR